MMTDTLAKSPYLDEAGNWTFSGSYDPDDVIFLLKPSSIEPTDIAEKESLIQSGERHYSEMLSVETVPDERYLKRSEEHTSELQSLMRISYAVFCLNNKINTK